MSAGSAAETLIKTAKLDSQTIIHLILLGVIAWLILMFVPNLMESHRRDIKEMAAAINKLSDDHKEAMQQMANDHKEAMQEVVHRLDKLLLRHYDSK